jgi:hypothetical protein
MIRDIHLGSGSRIQILIFTHPGSRTQRSKIHRIPDLDPQHWERGVNVCGTVRASDSDLADPDPSGQWIQIMNPRP